MLPNVPVWSDVHTRSHKVILRCVVVSMLAHQTEDWGSTPQLIDSFLLVFTGHLYVHRRKDVTCMETGVCRQHYSMNNPLLLCRIWQGTRI